MSSPIVIARNRLGVAVRHRNTEAERTARQDLATAKLSAAITAATAGQPPLRPEQREALVTQIRTGGAA